MPPRGGAAFWRAVGSYSVRGRTANRVTVLSGAEGHSLLDRMMAGDDSSTFRVGGHRWRLALYPEGAHQSESDDPGFVSVGLHRVNNLLYSGEPTAAAYRASVLGRVEMPAYGHLAEPLLDVRLSDSRACIDEFVKTEELKKAATTSPYIS